LLESLPVQLLSLEELPGAPDVIEDGSTFEENAVKKARSACRYSGEVSLGEDSGLAVDHLAGAPGILSARFAGEDATYEQNNEKLLSVLAGLPPEKRAAAFVCVAALSFPQGEVLTFRGTCVGRISDSPRGVAGFGYDPVFLVPEYGKTFAELGEDVKNRISHRAVAMSRVESYLALKLAGWSPRDPAAGD
jgi:XTP/dITP diphosphohydrolase